MREIVNKQRAPKDIVLNNILQEIGEENGMVVEPKVAPVSKKKSVSKKKKHAWMKMLFYVLLILFISIILFLFYLINTASHTEQIAQNPTQTQQKPVVWQTYTPKILPTQKKKKPKTTPHKSKTIEKLTSKESKILIHKRAKEALLRQMKN